METGSGIWQDGLFSHDMHKDLKKTEFIFKIVGIVPKRLALKSAIQLDLIKHSLKSEIHSNLEILHPNRIFLRIPPIDKLHTLATRKASDLSLTHPLRDIFEAGKTLNWLKKNQKAIYTEFLSKKAALISSYKPSALKWVANNITAKALKTWTSEQLSKDVKQYREALTLSGDKKAIRDSYITYHYHLYRTISQIADIQLKRHASGLVSDAKKDGLRLIWNGSKKCNI